MSVAVLAPVGERVLDTERLFVHDAAVDDVVLLEAFEGIAECVPRDLADRILERVESQRAFEESVDDDRVSAGLPEP